MSTLHRYNSRLQARLTETIALASPSDLVAVLDSLSVSEARTAGFLLSETLLPSLGTTRYWQYFTDIVPTHPKRFLGTFLKAAVKSYQTQHLQLSLDALQRFAATASPIDLRKTLEALLPILRTTQEVQLLTKTLGTTNAKKLIPFLIKAGTPPCYYHLFNLLKTLDTESEQLMVYARMLIDKGDHLSFNLVGIMRQYFDLKELTGTFSLQIPPYGLNRLDQSPEAFMRVLCP